MHRIVRRIASLGGGSYAVIERDFLVMTSTRRFLALRLGVAAVAALVVALTAIVNDHNAPDTVGRMVFGAAVVIVPMLVLLISPAAAAPAISAEREAGTLDLVLAAPVSAGTFVAAKFASRFLAISVLVFAMLPVAGVCFLFGGVPFETFGALVVFTLSTAAFCVSAGIAFSAFLRSVAAAVLGAFLFVLLAPLAPFAVLAVLDASTIPIDKAWYAALLPLQTFYVWGELGQAAFEGALAPATCWVHAGIMGTISALLLGVATLRMRREGRVTPKRERRRSASGLFLGNPLLDRGVRGSILWHPRKLGLFVPALAVIGDGLLLWAAFANEDLDEAWVHISGLGCLTVLGMLRMLATASTSISSERRRGSLDVLMATPCSDVEIVHGMLAGALLSTAPLLVLGLLHGTVAAAFGALHPFGVIAWAATAPILLLLTGAIGLRASASTSSPTRSSLIAFGVFFGALCAAGLAVFVMAVLRMDGDAAGAVMGSLPPVLAFYSTWLGHAIAVQEYYRYDDWQEIAPVFAVVPYLVLSLFLIHSSVRAMRSTAD